MRANQTSYPVRMMCRVLGVSPSGYYDWLDRPPSARAMADAALLKRIKAHHEASRGTYGKPRIHEDLIEEGIKVGGKRVARLMKEAGIMGVSRRKKHGLTKRDKNAQPIPDLVDRNFTADGPDQLWVADITYIPAGSSFLYLAIVLDVWQRKIVGWSMAAHLRTELVLGALEMAIWRRQPKSVIHHSDQGCQYTSIAFGKHCRQAGVKPSTGSVGDCYDNAMAESFFATLECELLDRYRFKNHREARMAVFDFIEGFYNPKRRHSGLGMLSPVNYEEKWRAEAA